ncbi:peptidylprolyl isomerase [Thiothrix lacustris]|uniref:peptidylprolyl isomerase n=1 Tax=Thiothrix lacustris TaxID=525917 RepID=UPI0027E57943|nr:peptidylprolyl isomerase [Thiothrix lacustris]WMP18128.1 peptidylprolyl isomerase [Thiothrix lacustris]
MRFKTNNIIATGLVGLTLIATSLYAADENKVTVATVNGTAITQDTLNNVMGMVGGMPGAQVDKKSVLDDLIITELARQEANKAGLTDRPEIKEKIKEATDRIVLNTWTQEKATSFKPTDDELKKAYEDRTSGEKVEYKARHILMKTKAEADGIIKELDNKVDFADLAKKSSDGPSASQGGDLGWFKPSTMVKPFADAVAKMEPGTYTKEPVQTDFGWHVIKLEERRDVKPPELETLKPQLEREYQQKKMLAYMDELKAKADIKVTLPAEAAKPAAEAAAPAAAPVPADAKTEEKK